MKNRILYLIQFPPPVHGSSLIGERIRNSQLLNETFSNDYINISTSRDMEEIGVKSINKIIRFLNAYLKTLYYLFRHRYSLCIFAITVRGIAFYRDMLTIILLKLFRIKYILLMNNKGVSLMENRKIDNILYYLLFKDTKVIQNSSYLYPDIKKYALKENIFILPNGIPEQSIFTSLAKQNTSSVNLLYLANMTITKGVFDLIDACDLLKKKNISFSCTFIGAWNDISFEEFTSYIIKKGLQKVISYEGKKYDNDKNQYFIQADIFVFPTFYSYECFPLVLLEAMQFNLPIVSTFEGGIPDIVEDGVTGFLVPQKNVNLLAEKLELLILDSELRKKMGKAGNEKYLNSFTLEQFEKNMFDILNSVIINE